MTTKRSITRGTFTIERVFPNCTPARAFAAFSTSEGKQKWFGGPPEEWQPIKREFAFGVGKHEIESGRHKSGVVSSFDACYYDIVPNERIIYTYEMHINDARTSVSVATVELQADGDGTTLTFTEQGAFLDGLDSGELRENGTGSLLGFLDSYLAGERASA